MISGVVNITIRVFDLLTFIGNRNKIGEFVLTFKNEINIIMTQIMLKYKSNYETDGEINCKIAISNTNNNDNYYNLLIEADTL